MGGLECDEHDSLLSSSLFLCNSCAIVLVKARLPTCSAQLWVFVSRLLWQVQEALWPYNM